MTPYDEGRKVVQGLLDEGRSRETAALEAGHYAGDAYNSRDDIVDFGTGVLDVLHDRPHRDGGEYPGPGESDASRRTS